MDIKPIETIYNGYRFRSRLEARWAVFFDAGGIKYEYEPEGFDVGKDGCYLPDFYLPEEDIYVEVKPDRQNANAEILKAIGIVNRYKKILLVLREIPYSKDCGVWWYPIYYYHPVSESVYGCRVTFLGWEKEGLHLARDFKYGIEAEVGFPYGYGIKDCIALSDIELEPRESNPTGGVWPVRDAYDNDFIKSCYTKARQARFEHGETPKVSR